MDKKYLNDEFDGFFNFPTDDKSQVSSVSCKLFAEHIAYPILMDNAMLTTQRDELLAALEKFGRHDRNCEAVTESGCPCCSCGLEDVIARAKESK